MGTIPTALILAAKQSREITPHLVARLFGHIDELFDSINKAVSQGSSLIGQKAKAWIQ